MYIALFLLVHGFHFINQILLFFSLKMTYYMYRFANKCHIRWTTKHHPHNLIFFWCFGISSHLNWLSRWIKNLRNWLDFSRLQKQISCSYSAWMSFAYLYFDFLYYLIFMLQGVYYYFYQILRNKAEVAALEHRKKGIGDGSVGMFSSLVVAALSG